MTDMTAHTLTSPALSQTWDHRVARAERLDALNAAVNEHGREVSRRDGPRWFLGLSLLALGGAA